MRSSEFFSTVHPADIDSPYPPESSSDIPKRDFLHITYRPQGQCEPDNRRLRPANPRRKGHRILNAIVIFMTVSIIFSQNTNIFQYTQVIRLKYITLSFPCNHYVHPIPQISSRTNVMPAPPNCTCSSRQSATNGTVRK